MKFQASALAFSFVLAFSAQSQETNSAVANSESIKHITAAEAGKHLNEAAIVTGKIAQVTVKPSIVILNLEKPYPDSPFSAVVFSRATNKFGALTNLEGKQVEISGTIKSYRGKPEIILTNATQLTIVGSKTK